MEQGSPEWFAARCGCVTASRVADVMAKIKSGEAATRKNYRAQLVAERLTGVPAESYTNAAMQWGIETEPQARAAYSFLTDSDVAEVGFIVHPDIGWTGASPDGLVDKSGMLEIKCPNTATHIDFLLSGSIPEKYLLQMQWQMECTGRDWCDFMSFDPRLPERHQTFIKRVDRDGKLLAEVRCEVIEFLEEVAQTIDALESR